MGQIAWSRKEAVRERITDRIIQRYTTIQGAQIRCAEGTERHSPGRFTELQIRRKVVNAATRSDDGLIAYAIGSSHARRKEIEPLFSRALLGMLARENKIQRASYRLAIHCNSLRR